MTAVDGAGRTATDVLRITVDSQLPAVSITTPATDGVYTSNGSTVVLTGAASDDGGITQVMWLSDRGPSGMAMGTTAWSTPPVRLSPGPNVFTVTARDGSDNVASAMLTIVYADTIAPAPSSAPQSPSGTAVVTPAATARDAQGTVTTATVPVNKPVPTETASTTKASARAATPPASAAPPVASAAGSQPPSPATPTSFSMPVQVTVIGSTAGQGDVSPARSSEPTPSAPQPSSFSVPTSTADVPEPLDNEPPSPPVVTIAAPTAERHETTEDTVTVSGTARHSSGITQVTWTTDHGESGIAVGRERWTISRLPLSMGTTVLTVTAHNSVGDLTSEVLTIVRQSAAAMNLAIQVPTTGPAWTTAARTVALRGVASDNVFRVTWTADWGGAGTASGTSQWTIPTIGLQPGANRITVRAHNRNGGSTERVITVNYTPRRASSR